MSRELGEFNVLVQALRDFQEGQGERDLLATEPTVLLRISVRDAAAPQWPHGAAELAYAEINLAARRRDVRTEAVPLLNSVDNGPMGSVSVSLRTANAITPLLAVRKAFVAADADGDGALGIDEVLPALRKVGVLADIGAVRAFNAADANSDGKLSLREFARLYRRTGAFDHASSRRRSPDPYAVPYAVATRRSERGGHGVDTSGGGGYGSDDGASAPPTGDPATAVLYAKVVPLRHLEAETPYSFWVDAHSRLEILEIALHPDPYAHACLARVHAWSLGRLHAYAWRDRGEIPGSIGWRACVCGRARALYSVRTTRTARRWRVELTPCMCVCVCVFACWCACVCVLVWTGRCATRC